MVHGRLGHLDPRCEIHLVSRWNLVDLLCCPSILLAVDSMRTWWKKNCQSNKMCWYLSLCWLSLSVCWCSLSVVCQCSAGVTSRQVYLYSGGDQTVSDCDWPTRSFESRAVLFTPLLQVNRDLASPDLSQSEPALPYLAATACLRHSLRPES